MRSDKEKKGKMNIKLFLRTVTHLKMKQLVFQAVYRLKKKEYVVIDAPVPLIHSLNTMPISKYQSFDGEKFSFLNTEHRFSGWNYTEKGMLWAYNQNYFDWINQDVISKEESGRWISLFIEEIRNNWIGLEPYPIALRSINWVKCFCLHPECVTKQSLDSLYSQLRLLEQKLEYRLMANHLLEDAYALYIGGSFFSDNRLFMRAEKLLLSQLKEQILPDGAHYEQSPMYHCILLDRLLDCINMRETKELIHYARLMLSHLESIVWADGSFPMLNDSANNIAPKPMQLFAYAKRLGIEWKAEPLKECGYRKMVDGRMEAFVDIGNITATYQPAHTHADTFNFELRIEGTPVVVDTGISTYNKSERRQYERSTAAHNCVSVDGKDSSEVWGGFRVGKRAKVSLIEDNENLIFAFHNGFDKKCYRKFEMENNRFVVEDSYEGDAVSFLHLNSSFDTSRVKVQGATKVAIKYGKYSTEYNRFIDCKVMEMHFKGKLKYIIQ